MEGKSLVVIKLKGFDKSLSIKAKNGVVQSKMIYAFADSCFNHFGIPPVDMIDLLKRYSWVKIPAGRC